MPSSPSQEASPPLSQNDQTVQSDAAQQSLTLQVHGRFADFRDRHPRSSFTSVLESGPTVNAAGVAEYIVRATINLEGRPLVSSLATAPTLEEAEDRARLRNLALAEAVISGEGSGSAMDYGSNDGLGDTMVNLGPLDNEQQHRPASPAPSSKPKPKPKKSAAAPKPANDSAAPPSVNKPSEPAEPAESATKAFVADWSEDLAQISVELKRLNWDSKQEQDYLQRTFNKSSRDDIIDHGELMDYLSHLQALPSNFEEESAAEDSPIADTVLSVDEADLAPKSVSELMASAGLKSGAEIPAPPPAVAPTVAETPDAATPDSDSPVDDTIVREPEPEIEIDDGPDEESEADDSQPPTESLTRSEMMDETARLCKQLGWKNRQGSDFLKATYNKATRKDLTDAEMMDFLEQLRSLSTTEALPY